MSDPIVLSTWTFGAVANAAAWPILSAGGAAVDAVEAGCWAVEADENERSVGIGGRPDRSGQVSLDASIMLSPSRCGGVCYVRRYGHPVSIARRVMDRTQHVLLAGEGAERFAAAQGFDEMPLLTDRAREEYEQWLRDHPEAAADATVTYRSAANIEENHDTVGVLALDSHGVLAGACSTSGLAYKLPGRVGDSPIIGHGLYVHPEYGAAVATGTGELVMGMCGSFLAVERMRAGDEPRAAIHTVLRRMIDEYDLRADHQVAMIALRPDGIWAAASLRSGYVTAVCNAEGARHVTPGVLLS